MNEIPNIHAALKRLVSMNWKQRKEELYHGNGGNKEILWCKSQMYYPLILNSIEARLLDFLANWQTCFSKNKLWFFCRSQDIAFYGFLSPTQQERAFNQLRKKKVITTRMKGNPARRIIRINYLRIMRLILKALMKWELQVKRWSDDMQWRPAACIETDSKSPGSQWVDYTKWLTGSRNN